MTEEEAFVEKQEIVSQVESLVESGHYTLEEITDAINDDLVHLVPE